MSPPDTRDLEPAALEAFHSELSRHIVHGEDAYASAIRAYLSALSEPAAPTGAEVHREVLRKLQTIITYGDGDTYDRLYALENVIQAALATPQPVEPPDDSLNDIAAENEAARDDEWGEAGE